MKLGIILFLSTISSTAAARDRRLKGKSGKKQTDPFVGVGDDARADYEAVANAFVGINPINGVGSGFVVRDITTEGTFGTNPASNTGRNDMCTCDCEPGNDGVGCVGWGGIAFRYSSLLWLDPLGSDTWQGQMQAFQEISGPSELNFIGNDIRRFPGGEVIYNVACTDSLCDGIISGAFRQSNGVVNCTAGLAEEVTDDTTCAHRCRNSEKYKKWIDFCAGDGTQPMCNFTVGGVAEERPCGFSGYDI
mmetsp:Transcript_125/g.226  ORF Transcript_125/g.226 Transcript_125/m.226 type:complete len:248 (-) Transcript_125:254-997(-)